MKKSLAIGFLSCIGLVSAIAPLNTKFLEIKAPQLQKVEHPELEDIGENVCLYNVDGSFYNLINLYNKTGYYETYVENFPNWKVVFNFCREIKPLATNCSANTFAAWVNTNGEGTSCTPLAEKIQEISPSLALDRPYSDFKVSESVQDSDKSKGRLDLLYKNGKPGCAFNTNSSSTSSLKLAMVCDTSANVPRLSSAKVDNLCEVTVAVFSNEACYKFSTNPLIKWMSNQYILIGILLILAGLVLGIMGKRFFKYSLCLVGTTVFTVASTLFLFSVFLSRDSGNGTGWIIFSICLVLSMIGGLLLAKFFRVGVFVAAGWGGVVLGLILYNSFVYKADSQVVFWIFIVLMGLVCGVLGFYFTWPAIIIATSISGAYALIRGISVFAGGYPPEMEIINRIKEGDFKMPYQVYIYLASFVILSILFMVWQFKRYGSEEENGKGGQRKYVHHYHKMGGKKGYRY